MSKQDDAPQSPTQPGRLERTGQSIADSPTFQGLADIAGQLVGYVLEPQYPGASVAVPGAVTAMKASLSVALSTMKRKRVQVLNEAVAEASASRRVELTADVLHSEDFLHAYEATLRATLHTRREEKIRLFARLLVSAIQGADLADVDEFEELLGILDDMSVREIRVVVVLDRLQTQGNENTNRWEALKQQLADEVAVQPDEIDGVLVRLMRTGLYSENVHTLWGGNRTVGTLTARYYRLRQLIQDPEGNVIAPDANRPDA